MTFLKPQLLAQGKGKMPIIIGIMLCCAFVSGIILPYGGAVASEESLHAAAERRVVAPNHDAATLLAVVDQEDIRANHRILADNVLRSLPSYCRQNLQSFYVKYDPKNKSRGLGGATTIIVTGLVPDREFMALIVHECGHVTDLGGLRGTAYAGTTRFYDGSTAIYADDPSVKFYSISWASASERKAGSKDTDFASGYAASDPFEDFAESFAFYALQQKEFARLAQRNKVLKAKYDFMERVVFAETGPVGRGTFTRGKQVPWDVTRLPYTWHAKK